MALAVASCAGEPKVTPSADAASKRVERRAPNVLIIVTDDQRATGTWSVMPATRRWFATGGTRFTEAFATTPLCCPARASIFTGRYAHNHGVLKSRDAYALDQRSTLQRYLQDAGYRTAIFGKYLNDWDLSDDPQFFDRWGIFSESATSAYYDGPWNLDGKVVTVSKYGTDFIASRAVEFLRTSHARLPARPWFLYLAPGAPHWPRTPAAEYSRAPVRKWNGNPAVFEKNRSDKHSSERVWHASLETARPVRRDQLRTLMSVDDLVRKVSRTLAALGETRETLAFYLSDNGVMWGEHHRLGKTPPYEPSVKVPFLMRWPGRVAAGTTDRRLVANIDIVPTVMAAAGIAPDKRYPVDGMSLLGDARRQTILLENWQSTMPWASLWSASPKYQYIEYYDDDGSLAFTAYYDLESDPWQLRNLLHDRNTENDPEVSRLHDVLTDERRCDGSECP